MTPRPRPTPGRIRIGCSGWNYSSWRGRFYPDGLPAARWLSFYATHFDTVESNATFYRLPEVETFAAWAQQTPRDFVMGIKASRYLTHLKKLRDPHEPLQRLFERAAPLGTRMGPVLYQLPGQLHADLPRLEVFLAALPAVLPAHEVAAPVRLQHVLEFRHPSWYDEATYTLLQRHDVALCLHDMAGSAVVEPFVGPIVYVRFHGAGGRYFGSYPESALYRWAERLTQASRDGRDVYAYFNNDPDAAAPRDAAALRALVDARLSSVRRSTR